VSSFIFCVGFETGWQFPPPTPSQISLYTLTELIHYFKFIPSDNNIFVLWQEWTRMELVTWC